MQWVTHGTPFPLIVAWIAQHSELGGRTLVDRTGLQGNFACKVSYAREDSGDPGPSFLTAVHEQMGLKIRSGKGPVETILVDHVERQSEN